MSITSFKNLFKQRLFFFLLLGVVFLLPFLDGGTNFLGQFLLLVLPLPLLLLSFYSRQQKPRFYSSHSVIFLLAFLVFCFLSIFSSSSLALSVPKFFELVSLFLFFNLFLLVEDKDKLKLLAYIILLVAFFLCLLSSYYLIPSTKSPESTMNLVYAIHGHNHLAEYLCFVLPVSFACFIKGKKRKILFGALTTFYFINLVFTFSRTSLLFLPLISFLMIKRLEPKHAFGKATSWLFVILPTALLLFFFLLPFTSLGRQARQVAPYDWLVRQAVKPLKVERRLDYWPQAIEGVRQKPLLGWGIGTFRLTSQRFQKRPASWSWFTHNFYLQALSEVGIFGFFSFLIFLVLALRSAWRSIEDNPFEVGSFFALLFSSLHSLFDFDWEFPAIFLTFLALLAVLVKRKKYLKQPKIGRSMADKIKNISHFALFFLALSCFLFGQARLLGELYWQRGDYEKALSFYPWSRENWLAYAETGGEKVAIRAIVFNRNDPSFYSLLAEEYESQKEHEKAIEMFKKVISLDPLNLTACRKLERLYEKGDLEDEKIILYGKIAEKAKNIEPESQFQGYFAKTLYKLGLFYYQKGDWQKTEGFWRQSVRIAPQWSYFYVELANLYDKQGKPEEAKKVLEGCFAFKHPKYYCGSYLKEGRSEPPGAYKEKILAIPDGF